MNWKNAPFAELVCGGDVESLRRRLDRGCDDVNQVYFGKPLLTHAAICGYTDVVDLLLQHGAFVDALDDDWWTALHDAVLNDRIGIVKSLIAAGCNINVAAMCPHGDNYGTPLWMAVICRFTEAVTLLVEAGADVRLQPPISTIYWKEYHAKIVENREALLDALKPRHRTSLLNWLLAMAPLEMPICRCFVSMCVLTSYTRRHLSRTGRSSGGVSE
jgi:ankyrin repeat protein